MKYMFCLLLLLSMPACHQLTDSLTTDISGANVPEDYSLSPGESDNFQIFYRGINSIILKLTNITSTGIYALDVNRVTGDLNIPPHLSLALYNDSSCTIEQSMLYRCWYNDKDNHVALMFEVSDTADKYLKIFLADPNAHGDTFNIFFSPPSTMLADPFPFLNTSRGLPLGSSLTGCFSGQPDGLQDDFTLQGTGINTVYKLSLDLDYGSFDFLKDANISANFFTATLTKVDILKREFQTKDRVDYYYSLSVNETATFRITGLIAITYTVLNVQEATVFSTDAYEPDNGPVSVTPDTIDDTGISNTHTLLPEDTDWIKFLPSGNPADTYQIYIILDETWYDSGTQASFGITFDLMLIQPNGAESVKQKFYLFNTIPAAPLTSADFLSWENTAGLNEEWFLKIKSSSPARYRIEVLK